VSEHIVNLDESDSLTFKFVGASSLTFSMSYDMIMEAALQKKLQEMQKRRYREQQEEGPQGLPNVGSLAQQQTW